ncbi:MAG: response regulator receiver sensor signal transduction histidine kinase [Verrucomicrobiales bacterium]|nr:response regulator receiver sensor signal transduction histidine kinase [Verrucomicrobiales bacterium]
MPSRQPFVVFVVDDDAGLLRLVSKSLAREGFTVSTACSGSEAIAWLTSHEADLMLLDLKLPDLQGRDLIHQLTRINRQLPFIIITGQGDERVAVEMMKTGALDYLVKDAQFIEFLPAVVHHAFSQIERGRRLEIAEKQARLSQTVVEQSYSAVIIFSQRKVDPDIHYVNPSFVTLTGIPRSSLVGNSLTRLEELTGPWPSLRRVITSGKPFRGEMRLLSKLGSQLVFDSTMAWVFDHSQAPTHLVVVMRDITEKHQLEREILDISDREQARIGRDLHDGLGQQLTALEFFVTSLKDDVKEQAPALVEPMDEIASRLREAIRHARGMANGLSPVSLHGDGLATALQKLAENTRTLAKVKCHFIHPESSVEILDEGVANQLFRIAQESVNNALKHGRPKLISISLSISRCDISLLISDDGRGFAPAAISDGGMGLRAMNYRADLIGAVLTIDSAPRKGTRIICNIHREQ